MRKLLIAGAVLATLALNVPAHARQAQDFSVLNRTGMTIVALYVSEIDENSWEEDILGRDVLENGQEVAIRFKGYDDDNCDFDIRIDDDDDNEWIVEDIDLCRIHKVTFTKKGSKVFWQAR